MVGKGSVSRWGGEEFLFLFNNCMLEEAVALLDETLSEIRDIEIEIDETTKIRVTMTFGICQGSTDGLNLILKEADEKLYSGKNNGRNRIVK